ncbi:hypothetical protein OC842_005991 [Tilletia horrida]|uniref:Glutathione hydrolase n=1 Tax=Tilletia horrida TaxID=155126 RepID=A0AAN6G6X8_9BASI|nr:hypothetical protein OC842_005991 [Tilletia horrida]
MSESSRTVTQARDSSQPAGSIRRTITILTSGRRATQMPASADIDASERDALLSADEQRQAAAADAPVASATATEPQPRRSKAAIAKIAALHLLPLLVAAAVLVVFFLVLLPHILHAGKSAPKFRPYPASLARGNAGAVATENERCSQLGVEILRDKGGNAVDAAIAATLCIGTLNMFSAGIGGGGWAIVRAPSADRYAAPGKWDHTVVDFRETAPGLANETMFEGRPRAAQVGGLSVGVPGELRGLEIMHSKWGSLPWADLVEPAAKLADEAPVSRELERRLEVSVSSNFSVLTSSRMRSQAQHLCHPAQVFGSFMKKEKTWRSVFVHKWTRQVLKEGDTIRRRKYAKTLRTIAKEGPRALYVVSDSRPCNSASYPPVLIMAYSSSQGPIAQALVRTIKATGGIMTLTDLAVYKANTYPALEGTWAGKKIYTTGAPTSGPPLMSLLRMLEDFEQFKPRNDSGRLSTFGGPGIEGLNSPLGVHRYVEALKFAFGQRTLIGDPAYLSAKANAAIDEIPTEKRIKELRKNITDDRTHPISYYHPKFDIAHDHGTMSLSVIDKNGMAVTLTSTVNLIFGSKVMCPETGIILNDELDDSSTPGVPNAFGLAPSPYNYPEPGKRPLSSMAPTIVEWYSPKDHRGKKHDVNADADADAASSREGQHVFAADSAADVQTEGKDKKKGKKPASSHPKVEQPDSIVTLGGSGGSRIFGSVAQVLLHLDAGLDLSSAIERSRIHHQLLPVELDIETGGGEFEIQLANELEQRGHLVRWLEINLALSEVQAVQRTADGHVWGASDSRKQGVAAAY